MKSLFNFLVILSVLAVTEFTYSQSKGQVHFGLGSALINYSTFNYGNTGSLFNGISSGNSNSDDVTSSSFSFLVGYFPVDKVRIDGGMSINAIKNSDPAIYFNLGGRYFYYSEKKISLDGGISANFGITNGTERYAASGSTSYYGYSSMEMKKPINLSITPVEFQFWPLEGGALTADFTYTWLFLNGGDLNKEKSYGINIGLLIRLN